jgi:hypothetical protein
MFRAGTAHPQAELYAAHGRWPVLSAPNGATPPPETEARGRCRLRPDREVEAGHASTVAGRYPCRPFFVVCVRGRTMRLPSRTVATVVGWVVGMAAGLGRWPDEVTPVLATAAASAVLAVALVESIRPWWPRR